jgi:hypothetical protein
VISQEFKNVPPRAFIENVKHLAVYGRRIYNPDEMIHAGVM